jgi:DNA-binding LacI/PurR family transcriptional regulator
LIFGVINPSCTMQEVARRAGVHPATVSRALRSAPGVSDAVRIEIKRIARELKYRPNPLVSALIRTRRSPTRTKYHATLAFFTKPLPGLVGKDRHVQLLAATRTRAAQHGYRIQLFGEVEPPIPSPRLTEILLTRGIAGLIFAPFTSPDAVPPVDWRQFSVVAIGLSQRIPVTRVAHNHYTGMRRVLAECRRRGARRIGLVLPLRVHRNVEERWLAAYLLDQTEHPSPGGPLLPLLVNEAADHGTFAPWFRVNQPDVIVGLQHLTPIHQWVRALGLRVPADVGLVTLDRRAGKIDFSGLDQEVAKMGATAVDQLLGLVERGEHGMVERPINVTMDGLWLDGTTLRRAPG